MRLACTNVRGDVFSSSFSKVKKLSPQNSVTESGFELVVDLGKGKPVTSKKVGDFSNHLRP